MKGLVSSIIIGFVFSLLGCSEAKHPVDQLIESKTADEVFIVFGKPLFFGCMDEKESDQGKCTSEIVDAVAAAQKNGYGDVKPEHFTPEVKARLFTKLKTSLEYGNKRSSQNTNKYSRW